jgi:hypothetical protein
MNMKRKVDNIFNYNNDNKEVNRMPVSLSFSYHDETTNNDLINKHKLLPEIIEENKTNQNNITVETSTLSLSSTILQHEESLEHISNIESDETELNIVKIKNKIEQKNKNHNFLIC